VYLFRFCPDCGQRLPEPTEAPARLLAQTCPACQAVHYRNAKPCAGALVVRDGRLLLGRRAEPPALGAWDIPGGFLEPWEHPAEGAIREVAEETGLQVRPLGLFAVVVDTYDQGRWYCLNMYYLAEVVGGAERPADDLAELRWFAPDELPEMAFPAQNDVLRVWAARHENA
jgi:ADP-ribose pyrophosphatase YjhB (NUDIX family)